MNCRVVLSQTNPRLGDLRANLEDHVERVRAAAQAGADLVLFPELSLTGYFVRDQVSDLGLVLDSPEIARLAELSRQVSIGVGFVERTSAGRFYNSFAFLEDGAVLDVHRKVHLVSYGMFDESRDFATYVHEEMLGTLKTSNKTLKDLGVKRAPFVVLIGASMPSILAEVVDKLRTLGDL